jgi:flavin reductase (DIM6/NTAB) family NADH-FMN oxidoreductase RutF
MFTSRGTITRSPFLNGYPARLECEKASQVQLFGLFDVIIVVVVVVVVVVVDDVVLFYIDKKFDTVFF